MKDFKIKVTPEQSEIVQREMFKHKYFWNATGSPKVNNLSRPYLYFEDSRIHYSTGEDSFFGNYNLPELTFEEFQSKYLKKMTKFTTLNQVKSVKKVKETIFTHVVEKNGKTHESVSYTPKHFHNVMFIGHDYIYGDVFKVWNNGSDNFMLFFGIKGDEFND